MSQDMLPNNNEYIDSNEIKNDIVDDKSKNKQNLNNDKNILKKYINGKNIKIILSMFLILAIGIGLGFYVGTDVGRQLPATHKTYNKNQVFATVGDVEITGDDFAKRMEPYFYYHGLKKLSDEEIGTQEAATINYMTNLEALYQAATAEKITVTNDEIENYYSTTMSSITSTFNLREDEFLKKFDLSKSYVKGRMKKEYIATKYLQENSKVNEKEAKNYYNNNKDDFVQVRASHILISNYDSKGKELSDKEKEANKQKAENILKRIQNGESFDDLALENSDDSATSSKGGDLGYFGKNRMDEKFEEAAFSLKDNEVYPKVVETNYGYHIIKKTGQKYSDFENEKESLISTLTSNKQNALLQEALNEYNVKINI